MNETTFYWLTTSPNPRHPGTGWDAGQRGWRLHAVLAADGAKFESIERTNALCGTRARHGWGVDLFIDEECARCCKAMDKREAAGETFVDLEKLNAARNQEKLRLEYEAERAAEQKEEFPCDEEDEPATSIGRMGDGGEKA